MGSSCSLEVLVPATYGGYSMRASYSGITPSGNSIAAFSASDLYLDQKLSCQIHADTRAVQCSLSTGEEVAFMTHYGDGPDGTMDQNVSNGIWHAWVRHES